MKNIFNFLTVLLFAVPFAYIIVADIIDISKRIAESFNAKVKPVVILVTKSFINF